ncbi:alpha/beta fold hydrolase [Nocardia jejuensis]|uniref:alpha/beta fold hydrolase n=1 Tax=Nocardia jejuensis TaxID=328049 RepID=UPI0008379CA9
MPNLDGARGRLHYRRWPVEHPVAALALLPGIGQHSAHYHRFARALAPSGIELWTLDTAGHGLSEGDPERPGTLPELAADARTFLDAIRDRPDPLPVVLMGHSLGAATALAVLHADPDLPCAGLVLCGTPKAVLEGLPPRSARGGDTPDRVQGGLGPKPRNLKPTSAAATNPAFGAGSPAANDQPAANEQPAASRPQVPSEPGAGLPTMAATSLDIGAQGAGGEIGPGLAGIAATSLDIGEPAAAPEAPDRAAELSKPAVPSDASILGVSGDIGAGVHSIAATSLDMGVHGAGGEIGAGLASLAATSLDIVAPSGPSESGAPEPRHAAESPVPDSPASPSSPDTQSDSPVLGVGADVGAGVPSIAATSLDTGAQGAAGAGVQSLAATSLDIVAPSGASEPEAAAPRHAATAPSSPAAATDSGVLGVGGDVGAGVHSLAATSLDLGAQGVGGPAGAGVPSIAATSLDIVAPSGASESGGGGASESGGSGASESGAGEPGARGARPNPGGVETVPPSGGPGSRRGGGAVTGEEALPVRRAGVARADRRGQSLRRRDLGLSGPSLPAGFPVLVVHGLDDRRAPVDVVRKWAQGVSVELREYADAGHDLLHEPVQGRVAADIAAWVLDLGEVGG